MTQNKIVITHWVHQEIIDLLSPQGELVLNQSKETLPEEEILQRMKNAQAMMAFMPDQVDANFLEQCPELKIIGAALKGYDNFDVDACTRRRVWFTIVPDLLTIPTAELAIGLLLAISRNVFPGDRSIRSNQFRGWKPTLYGTGLYGSTVGILGMGQVGQTIARQLIGFETKTIYCDPKPLDFELEQSFKAYRLEFNDVVSKSDFLVCATPLTAETRHLVNTETLSMMKAGSYLVNIGRGSSVDENAVASALEKGHLAGYAADVFEMEDWALDDRPRKVNPNLLAQENKTLFTPHLGSAVDSVRKEIALEAARNIIQGLQGQVPSGAINRI